jgi:hypothetical protein
VRVEVITNGGPASASSARKPSSIAAGAVCHDPPEHKPASRTRIARSAPIFSFVRNPESLYPFAKCRAGVNGTASTE